MKRRSIFREILFYGVILLLIVFVLSTLFSKGNPQEVLTYDRVSDYIVKQQVKEIYVTNKGVVNMLLVDDKTVSYQLADIGWFRDTFDKIILENNAAKNVGDAGYIKYEVQPAASVPWWLSLLPWLLIIVAIVFIYFLSFRQLSGKGGKFNSFGKAHVKTPGVNEKDRVYFRDVAGADEEKEELVEIVEFLKDPQKFTALGAKIPHGVLLVGPPGTGKTLLAKAVAGEAGVPFFSISGSDFVEMYVGVGASRVRDLFDTARKSPASIIFIDEIDAVGRHRGAGLGGGHDEREQTLNQLLVEMDGFGSHEGIIVMAATNRPDILDPALLRPGRFDRRVTVNYPDMKGREEILKVHSRNKPLESDVDFHKVAQSTVGFTGADLANLLNEAALLAAKKNKHLIGMEEIEDSYMKALLGPQKKTRLRTEEDNKITAYHEAGHAVVSYFCKKADPIKFITIVPAGDANGVTVHVPDRDRNHLSRNEMLDEIRMVLGGRIAEELIMDDITTGASADIQRATHVARNMVTRYGMSEKLGTILYGSEHTSDEVFLGRDYNTTQNFSERTAALIDEEIQRIIGDCYREAKELLAAHIEKLHFVAQFLLKHESMDSDQFLAAMKDDATEEELLAIAAQKAEKSRRDNEKRAEEEAKKEAGSDTDSGADADADGGENPGDGTPAEENAATGTSENPADGNANDPFGTQSGTGEQNGNDSQDDFWKNF